MKEIENKNHENQITKFEEIVVREELNLAKLPIFLPTHTKRKSLKLKKRINDQEKQTIIVGIIKDIEVGVFTIFDYKVYLFLVWKYKNLTNENFELGIEFTFNEIISFLEMPMSGNSRKLIRESLERLKNIPVYFSQFIYKNKHDFLKKEDYINILSILSFAKFEDAREKRTKHRCKFHEYVVNNLDFNYTKPTLFNQLNQLKNQYAIILYRYLDLVFASHPYPILRKSWKQLGAELYLPYQTNSHIQQFLIPALKELKGKELSFGGLITDFHTEKNEVLIFKKSFAEIGNNEIDSDGFNIRLLQKLKQQYGEDLLIQTKKRILANKNKISNLNAFLVKSLKNGWILKETEEETILKKLEENKQQRKIQEKEMKKLQKELELQEQEENKYQKIFNDFSLNQKELIEKEAIRRIEKRHNKKFNSNDKIYFNDFSVFLEIVEILKEAESISR